MAELATAWVNIALSAKGISSQIEREVGQPLRQIGDKAGDQAGRNFAQRFQAATGKSLESFGKTALVATAALGAGLLGVAKAAGNLEAAVAASNQVMGDAADEVQAWAKTSVQAVGLSERAALEATTSFGQLGKIIGLTGQDLAGFSIDLVTLAADMAAFKDVPIHQALADLQSAFAGQTEVVRKYGIFLDESTLKAAYFRETGEKVTGTLTAQQRIIATNAALWAQTGDIQGQAAREADGFARQLDNLKASFENTAASVGRSVLPAVTSLVKFVGNGINAFGRLNEATGGVVGKLALFGTAGLGVVGALSYITGRALAAVERFRAMSEVVGGFANRLRNMRGALLGVGGVIAAAVGVYALYSREKRKVGEATDYFIDALKREREGQADATAAAIAAKLATEDVSAVAKAAGVDFGDMARYIRGETVPAIDELISKASKTRGGIGALLLGEGGPNALDKFADDLGVTTRQAQAFLDVITTSRTGWAQAQAELALLDEVNRALGVGVDQTAGFWGSWAKGLFAARDVAADANGTFEEVSETLGKFSIDKFGRRIRDGAAETGNALQALADGQMRKLEQSAGDLSGHLDDVARALDDVFGSALDVEEASDNVRDQFAALTEAVKANGKSLDENTAAGRANRDQVRQSVRSVQDYIKAMVQSGASNEDAAAAYAWTRQQLISQMRQFGLTEQQAEEYINRLGLTPDSVTTAVNLANVGIAKSMIQEHIARLGRIPAHKFTQINAAADRGDINAVERELNNLARERYARIRVQYSESGGGRNYGSLRLAAWGGYVPGGSWQNWVIGERPWDEAILTVGHKRNLAKQLQDPRILRPILEVLPVAPATSGGGTTAVVNHYGQTVTPDTIARGVKLARLGAR